MADQLHWTTDTPSTPGVYWVRQDGDTTKSIQIHRDKCGQLFVDVDNTIRPSDVDFTYAYWYGPLEEPPFEAPRITLSKAQQDIFVRWICENVFCEFIKPAYLISKIRGDV